MITALTLALNEDEALPRLNASIAGLCDQHLVVDTGSDHPPEIEPMATPACVRNLTWVDFGATRTAAAQLVPAGWFLFLDADMTVEAVTGFREWLLEEATADGYMVEVRDGDLTYRLPLLLRAGCDWRWVGATHEYLDQNGHVVAPNLTGLVVHHHADGANRATKHQRDLDLLAPLADAGDARAMYYSAQAAWCLGSYELAAGLYLRRAAMGGFEEERWHAVYMAGRCQLEFAPDLGVRTLLRAHRDRPSRAEPMFHLAEWARQQRAASPPKSDLLFVESSAYG